MLSNRLVRYAAIQFDAQLKNYPAKEAFARHSMSQTYGINTAQWELRIEHGKAVYLIWQAR